MVADVVEVTRDRYGRTVARVSCSGQDEATSQVRSGMARVYDRYSRPDSPLYSEQAAAKAARRGGGQGPGVALGVAKHIMSLIDAGIKDLQIYESVLIIRSQGC